MKAQFPLIILFIAIFFQSFVPVKKSEKIAAITGKYGICYCKDEKPCEVRIELIIHENFTFQFYDNSDENNIIDVKGNWKFNNHTILLKYYQSVNPIFNKWKMDDDEVCIRSRRGFEFTRLCKYKSE